MKTEKIHDALNHLDDDMVERVDELRKRRRTRNKVLRWSGLAACLCAALLTVFLPMVGGTPRAAAAGNLMEGIEANPVTPLPGLQDDCAAVTDFGVRLFQNSLKEGENTLISPLSVLSALAMTANGAEGETLTQMEQVLGLERDALNQWLYTYTGQLAQGEKYKLSLANSIWFTNDASFTVEQDFLQTNADYYGADIYSAPFNSATLKDINNWVKDKTDGMIPEILDEIDEETVMCLVNGLAFDAEWAEIYRETQVRDNIFTTEDGVERQVEMLYGEEFGYLEDENAAGFIKYYKDRRYAFVALLPKEGVSVAQYANTLTGEHLWQMLQSVSDKQVLTGIPKFRTETSLELGEVLINMGMPDAFDYTAADFSGLGSSAKAPIVIDRVAHKTFIAVDEKGTRAGAATAVVLTPESAAPSQEEPKRVILDRPFLYMLIDCETDLPFFIGSMMDLAT